MPPAQVDGLLLLLFRHAEAEPENPGGDRERRLTSAGRLHALRTGTLLASRRLVPDLVVTSPAARAVQTWDAAAPAFGVLQPPVRIDDELWEEDAASHAATVARHAGSHRRLLLVGHEPGFGRYTQGLVGKTVRLGKGAVATVRLESWDGSGAALVEVLDG